MESVGRYKIVRELGRGAMGVVYLATDPTIGRPVAIKTIKLSEVSNPEERARLRERLFREARSAGVLSHPGIVTIYDMQAEEDLAYIAMEYVNGPTLDQLVSDKPLDAARMFSILNQTAVALDYAHNKGIVHRDIKPANIMVTDDGMVKITDFGIAKINTSDQFTMTGSIVGTPHYMAPEQVQGQPVDGQADQFSLAVIVFEMLTGEKPFTGEQLTTVVYKIVADEPIQPHRLNGTLSQQISNVLRKGLAKKPEARYGSCQKFIAALDAACKMSKGWKPLARGQGQNLPTAVEARRPDTVSSAANTEETKPRKKRIGAFSIVLALLIAAGLVGLIAWQAAPWLTDAGTKIVAETKHTAAPAPLAPEDKKPSPMGRSGMTPPEATEAGGDAAAPPKQAAVPPVEIPAPAQTDEQVAHSAPPRPLPPPKPSADLSSSPYRKVSVSTVPADAVAMLDDHPDNSCTTPCALDATTGRHTVTITRNGYKTEHREVMVAGAGVDIPPIALRIPGGVLMLASDPTGARIFVNGTMADHPTPARLDLAPGRYNIMVEKDGRQATKQVEIQDGSTRFEKILMDR